MRRTAGLGLLLAAVLAAGCARSPWDEIVSGFGGIKEVLVPIEAADLLALTNAAKTGEGGPGSFPRLSPGFVYGKAQVEGRELIVRLAYTEEEAPEGAVMTMSMMDFLHSAVDDPKAEGLSVNGHKPFGVALSKDQARQLIEALKKRGSK